MTRNKKILIIIIAFLVVPEMTFSCGGAHHAFAGYFSAETTEGKNSYLKELGCTPPISYSPRIADPLLVDVVIDAIKSGVDRGNIEGVLIQYNCAYGARSNPDYKKIIEYINQTREYDAFCKMDKLQKTFIVKSSGGAVLRSGPSTSHRRVDAVAEGSYVVQLGIEGEWYQVTSYAGEGYIYSGLLEGY